MNLPKHSRGRIRRSSKTQLFFNNVIFLLFFLSFTIAPIFMFIYSTFPENLLALVFIAVGLVFGYIFFKNTFKYLILKQPYEFYIISYGYGEHSTSTKYQGSEIGLPDRFCDLSEDEKTFLNRGIFFSHVPISKQIESMKQDIKNGYVVKKRFTIIRFIPVLFLFGFVISRMFFPSIFSNITPGVITIIMLVVFFSMFFAIIIVILFNAKNFTSKTNKTNKKQNYNDLYNNRNSKYYIEEKNDDEEDMFADFYKKNK